MKDTPLFGGDTFVYFAVGVIVGSLLTAAKLCCNNGNGASRQYYDDDIPVLDENYERP